MAREPGLADGGQDAAGRIDVHAHHVPAELQASLPEAPAFRGFAAWQPHSALEMMDRQGIATAILSMVLETALFAAPGDAAAARRVARSANEAAAEAIRSFPGRFGGFARLPLPDVDAAPAEIDYVLGTLRLDGVVLLGFVTDAVGFAAGDDAAGSGAAADAEGTAVARGGSVGNVIGVPAVPAGSLGAVPAVALGPTAVPRPDTSSATATTATMKRRAVAHPARAIRKLVSSRRGLMASRSLARPAGRA